MPRPLRLHSGKDNRVRVNVEKLVRGQEFEVLALYRLSFSDEVGVKLPA